VCTRRASDHASSRSALRPAAGFPASRVSRLCRRWALRVSSCSASFGAAGCKSPGFPESSTVLPRLSMQPSGLPEFCIFRLFRRWFIEFPRIPHPSALRMSNLQVSPALRFPHRLAMSLRVSPNPASSGCRRWFFEFPRVPHPSALLSSNLRVSPDLLLKQRLSMIPQVSPVPQSSGCAGDGASSFLESRILQRYRRREAPGFPESPLLQHRLLMSLRVSPATASSGCADGEFPGIPDPSLHRLRRLVCLRVSPVTAPSGCSVYASSSVPESCIHGWVDDDSPLESNFASPC
jgi:hypothetical protein